MSRNEISLTEMYGAQDLGASPLFAGDYINFGLWEPVDPMTIEGRARASERLYDRLAGQLSLEAGETVLEVGCGRGVGLRKLAVEKKVAKAIGVDASQDQVDRAKGKTFETRVEFHRGTAEDLPLPDRSVSAILSVEAAQHFTHLQSFVKEMTRVLAPGGKFALTTFFLCPGAEIEALKKLIPTVRDGIDIPVDIAWFKTRLESSFSVQVESIGAGVWPYFDRWIALADPNDWGRNWKVAWELGLIDYYVISGNLK